VDQLLGVIVLDTLGREAGPLSTITISDAVPVPVGTYTMTVVSNGSVNAWPADSGYTQSVISGASTFTVSDF
jgi:hypothetical protein